MRTGRSYVSDTRSSGRQRNVAGFQLTAFWLWYVQDAGAKIDMVDLGTSEGVWPTV
jgi:hypothetical protein